MYLISNGGASCNIPDTMDAIMLTKNINYIDGVKLDVRMSLDNVIVVSKYNNLNKFTMSNKSISNSKYQYLRNVKFKSHVFKYYIPTIKEVLDKYKSDKIIVLEIYNHQNLDIFLDNLYKILLNYSYKYYFISGNNDILNRLLDKKFNNLGIIVNDQSNIKLLKKINSDSLINNDNILLISDYPEKIHKLYPIFDKK